MKRLLLTSGVLLSMTLAAQTQAPPASAPIALTLPEAEAMAIKNNPAVSVALLSAAAANQVTLEVRSALLPTAFVSATGVGALTGSNLSAGALGNSSVLSRLSTGINISQLITDFGRTRNLTESSRLRAQAEDQRAVATRAEILLQVDRAYFAALRASEVLTVAQQTVSARQLVSDQVTALANSQLKSGLDVSFANVNLAEAKLLLLDAQNQIRSAQAELSEALGYRLPQTFSLTDPGANGPPPPDSAPLIQTSFQNRPELASARAEYASAQKFTIAERELRNPVVTAIGSAGVTPEHVSELRSRYAAAGVNVNIPVFNGHLFAARQTEAAFREQAASKNIQTLENGISRDVQVAFLNADTAWQRVGLTAELLNQASQALDLAQARYDLGLSSIVELSQAQLNKTSAQINNASAKYDYALQREVLNYQVGLKK